MSNKEAKHNGDVSRCSKCVSLTKEVKSQENKRIDQFLFFKQKIINFDKLIRTLLQQKSIVENECRALKAQVDHLWPCQQENEQLRESKREIDETVVDIRTELDSKETTIFQLNAKFLEAEKEKMDMLSDLDVYKVAYRDEKKKCEKQQQKLKKSKEIGQDKRKIAKLLKDSVQRQSTAEEKLQNLKFELVTVRKESKKAEREWKSQYKLKLKQRLQLGVLSDLDSSSNATPRRKRKRQNPNSYSPQPSSFPEASTPSNFIPEPSDDSSQSSSDSDMSDVSQISSIQSINIFQSLEDAIQWTLPAMSPLRSHTPNDTLDSTIPLGSPLPNLSPLHSPSNLSPSLIPFNPLNEDLHLSSSSQSNSSSSSDSSPGSSPTHTPPLSPKFRRKLAKSKSLSEPSLSPFSNSPDPSNTPSCSSRVTRSLAKQLNISIPSLQENTPDPPKVTRQHSRSRTTSENTLSDIVSPTRVQLLPANSVQSESNTNPPILDISCQSDGNSVEDSRTNPQLRSTVIEDISLKEENNSDKSPIPDFSSANDCDVVRVDDLPMVTSTQLEPIETSTAVNHIDTTALPSPINKCTILDLMESNTLPSPINTNTRINPVRNTFLSDHSAEPDTQPNTTDTQLLPMETNTLLSQYSSPVQEYTKTVNGVTSTTTLDVLTESREIELSPDPSEDAHPPTTRSRAKLASILLPTELSPPQKLLSPPYVPVTAPRRSARLSTTPDITSPVQPAVFLLPPPRPSVPTVSPLPPPILPTPFNKPVSRSIRTMPTQNVIRTPAVTVPVRKNANLPAISPSRTRSAKRKRKSKMRKSKTQCMHSIERDRQSKPIHTNPSKTERRVVELPMIPRRGSRQLPNPPSSSKILSEYLKETSQQLKRSNDTPQEFSQMKTKKVSNLIALSDEQSTEEICRGVPSSDLIQQDNISEVVVVDSGVGVRDSEGESDVEMSKGPTKRVVGRGRQRRRIKRKVYISESDDTCSEGETTPPDTQELGLREETVVTEITDISCSPAPDMDTTALSVVTDSSVCLRPERMRTLFPIPATRVCTSRPVYSLDSLGFYDVTPVTSTADIVRVKQEFAAGSSQEEIEMCMTHEVVDLTDDGESGVEVNMRNMSSDIREDVYMSPLPSPISPTSSFTPTPSSSELTQRPLNRSQSLVSSSPCTHPGDSPVTVKTTRSGVEYRSYLTTDFSNEESSLPFANFLSQTSVPAGSPQPTTETTTSLEVVTERGGEGETGDVKMDLSMPVTHEMLHTDSLPNKQTVSSSSYWASFLPGSSLRENTTITELVSSYTFSSQSTSELFQATKTKFEAQSSKQKQTRKRNKSAGKRGDKNFPAKRGYVVGQGDTQDTDSDEEIDCMLQELREKKETAKKKPDRPKTAAKKIVVIGALKRNEEQSPYAYVVKTLERLRLGALKVQDILLMLKNPENIHNSLPIIQGIIKFLQMLPVAVEDTLSQLIKHVCYFNIRKNTCYTPLDKLSQIGIPEEEPLMMKCTEDCWLDLTYWTRHSSYSRDVISPSAHNYPPILAPFEAQLVFLIMECNKAPHLGEKTKYPLLQTLTHCLESILFGIKPNIHKITAIYTYSRLTSACRILTTIYRLQDNIDKMGFFFMALPLQRLDFSVADILLYQSMGVVWPKVLRRLPDQIVPRDNEGGYKVMPKQVFLSTMQVIFNSILYSDYTLQVYYPCFTTLELICDWDKPNLYWPEDTMSCFTEELIDLLITSPEVRIVNSGCKRELSLLAHKIAVSLQTIAKVKDSQWVHKCLVHKLLMPAFAEWASQKGLEDELGLTSYINTDNSRAISNPVAMCIISVFGYLKKLRFIRDERQPVKQQSLLINILYTSMKSSKVPLPVQYSCADALLDALQIKSPQDRDITRCLTSWYKNLEKNKGITDPLVQLYNSKLQTFENQRIEL